MSALELTPEGQLRVMPLSVIQELIHERNALREERDEARKQLRVAVGLLSTTPKFQDQHPEEAWEFVKKAAK